VTIFSTVYFRLRSLIMFEQVCVINHAVHGCCKKRCGIVWQSMV